VGKLPLLLEGISMNLIQIRKAAILLKDCVRGFDTIVLDNGGLALHVHFNDDSQKVFKDIADVINWLQVQKLKARVVSDSSPVLSVH
jgi:hypothetical protein